MSNHVGIASTKRRSSSTAAEIACPTERAAFLDGPAADDRQLRAAVERLLDAHDAGRQLPARHPPDRHRRRAPLAERPEGRHVIGPYKLLEQIGEGGMGIVFMAEQTAAGPPQGRAEGHQAGHGHAAR